MRAPSVNSNSSLNTGLSSSRPGQLRNHSRVANDKNLQVSDTKSLVRVALKNQRREQKVVGSSYQSQRNGGPEPQPNPRSGGHHGGNTRNRVVSGAPFLRSQQNRPTSSHGIDIKNKARIRDHSINSNLSNGSSNKRFISKAKPKTNCLRDTSTSSARSGGSNGGMINGLRNQNVTLRQSQPLVTVPSR